MRIEVSEEINEQYQEVKIEDQSFKEGKTYTYDEAVAAATEYFKGDSLAASVWVSKYALKDSEGQLFELTPDDMHWRIANEIARIENKYPNPMSANEVFDLLKDLSILFLKVAQWLE